MGVSYVMATINLTKGKSVLVDNSMYEYLNQFKWFFLSSGTGYAAKQVRKLDGKKTLLLMHHLIIGYPLNRKSVDHINGNSLDNRRSNLRIVSHRQNHQNERSHRNGRLPGCWMVSKSRNLKKPWGSCYSKNNRNYFIGYFPTEKEAHEAYLKATGDN